MQNCHGIQHSIRNIKKFPFQASIYSVSADLVPLYNLILTIYNDKILIILLKMGGGGEGVKDSPLPELLSPLRFMFPAIEQSRALEYGVNF